MNIKVKAASLLDLDELVSMGHELYKIEKQFEPLLKFSIKGARERYKMQLQYKKTCFLVAKEGTETLGYLYGYIRMIDYFSTSLPEAEVEVIYLKPQARGKGIAKLLINEFLKWAKTKKAFRVSAGIYEGNLNSKNLFIKNGFNAYHTFYKLDLNN